MKYLKTAKMNQIYFGKNLWKHNQSVKSYIPIKKIRKGSQKKYPNEITVLIKKHRLWQRYIETKNDIIFQNYCKIRKFQIQKEKI